MPQDHDEMQLRFELQLADLVDRKADAELRARKTFSSETMEAQLNFDSAMRHINTQYLIDLMAIEKEYLSWDKDAAK